MLVVIDEQHRKMPRGKEPLGFALANFIAIGE
jgi:hypothetical protein